MVFIAMMNQRHAALVIVAGAVGGAAAIAAMQFFSFETQFPLVSIPFATSIVSVTGSPEVDAAQPRALVGGHLVSTVVGLSVVHLAGPGMWQAALAVGLAMIAMHLTRTFHPPAGIDPLVAVVNNMSWSFLLAPVGLGALLLVVFTFAWHNLARRIIAGHQSWPLRWW
jgi:CBS-domain-containing membrane protein